MPKSARLFPAANGPCRNRRTHFQLQTDHVPVGERSRRRQLHRVELFARPIFRVHRQERRLGQETRPGSVVGLRSVDQERMAQVDRAGFARRGHHRAMRAAGEIVDSEVPQRHTGLSGRAC